MSATITARVDAAISFPGVSLTYAEGALHSADDKPALVYNSRSGKILRMRHLEIRSMRKDNFDPARINPTVIAWWVDRALGYRVGELGEIMYKMRRIYGESRWYDRGDLHRDQGPAVEGYEESGVYWYKYYRGALGCGPPRVYSAAQVHFFHYLTLKGCSLNSYSRTREHFECAPGAYVCAEIASYPNKPAVTRIYQNEYTQVVAVHKWKSSHKSDTHKSFELCEPVEIREDTDGEFGNRYIFRRKDDTMRGRMRIGCDECNAWPNA
jgi:hypothetical protein